MNTRARKRIEYAFRMGRKGYTRLRNDDRKLQWYHTIDMSTKKFVCDKDIKWRWVERWAEIRGMNNGR